MSYFKIGSNDYSSYIRGLKIKKAANYNAQTNAAGDTVVDYINHKRKIEVSFIFLEDEVMQSLQQDIDAFNVSVSFRNPQTGTLEENVNCIVPNADIEYFTIQVNRVLFKECTITFNEL